MLHIREATEADFEKIWPIFQAIASAGDTYAYPTDVAKPEGKRLWLEQPRKTFVAEDDGELLGTYYIKTNQAGPGAHACNCGYKVAATARWRGIASAMCEHSRFSMGGHAKKPQCSQPDRVFGMRSLNRAIE